MSQSSSQHPTPPDGRSQFAARSPSATWEQVVLPECTGNFVWVWVKPPVVPNGIVVRLPDECLQQSQPLGQLTMRKLLSVIGVDPGSIATCYLFGIAYEGKDRLSELFEQTISQPPPGVEPEIAFCMDEPVGESDSDAAVPEVTEEVQLSRMFARIESDWQNILQLERHLALLRKQVTGMLSRVNSLNRDLTAEEGANADSNDKSNWQDARRWLREAASRLTKFIKEHDLGVTSAVGKRNWFEQIYVQFIAPRLPFEGMQQAQRDYESYRKLLQTLWNNMNAAHSSASQDAERRAKQVLNSISGKVRASRVKKK